MLRNKNIIIDSIRTKNNEGFWDNSWREQGDVLYTFLLNLIFDWINKWVFDSSDGTSYFGKVQLAVFANADENGFLAENPQTMNRITEKQIMGGGR